MITYTDRHQPKSISLLHVTEYIEKLIEVSEHESKLLLAYAINRIEKHESQIRKDLKPHESIGTVPPDPAQEGKPKFEVTWFHDKITNQIVPSCIRNLATTRNMVDWVRYDLNIFDWTRLPHFEILQGSTLIFPELWKTPYGHSNSYEIDFLTLNNLHHNRNFPSKILYCPEKGITHASYMKYGNRWTFWEIYDKATPQDKKILIRDWLPIEEAL